MQVSVVSLFLGLSNLPYSISYTDGSGVNETADGTTITWKDDGSSADSYQIKYVAGKIAPTLSPHVIVAANLTADNTYSYRICALDGSSAVIGMKTGKIELASTKFDFDKSWG